MEDTRDKEISASEDSEKIEKIQKENNVMSPWAAKFFRTVNTPEEAGPSQEDEACETVAPEDGGMVSDGGEDHDKAAEQPADPDVNEAVSDAAEISHEEVKKSGINVLALFLAFTVVIIVTVFITFFTAKKLYAGQKGIDSVESVNFADEGLDAQKIAKFQDIIEFVKENYYTEYDMNELVEGAIEGFVEALGDPYGSYYAPGDMDGYTSFIDGSYTGIGFKSSACDEGMKVIEVFEDSPAERAGIVAGDIVTAIDGTKVSELSSEEISAKLGIQGTEIRLGIIGTDGVSEEISLTVEVIKLTTVHYKALDNDIKYIYISQFIDGTAEEFKEALETAASGACRGIVIDLRNNPGGYEKEASSVADMLLPEGTIATSRDRHGNVLRTVKSDKNEITVPVVLLVNQNSASAAELLTGAFRDFEKGEIVGVKTYGKALAQINHVYDFDGSGIVLTTSRYFTPSGECIDGVGIEPTVNVEIAEEYRNLSPLSIPAESDSQLAKAIEIIEGASEN